MTQGDRPELIFPEWGVAYKKALANAKLVGAGGWKDPDSFAQFRIFEHQRAEIVLRIDAMLVANPAWTEVSQKWFVQSVEKEYVAFRKSLSPFWDFFLRSSPKVIQQAYDDSNAAAVQIDPSAAEWITVPREKAMVHRWGRVREALKVKLSNAEYVGY